MKAFRIWQIRFQ